MQKLRWTYFIYYTSDGEVYAYTDDVSMHKQFKLERDMKQFYYKKCSLTSEDIRSLYDYYPEAVMKTSALSGVPLVVTLMEQITVDQYSVNCEVSIPTIACINPDVFTDEVREALEIVGYIDAYNYYMHGNNKGSVFSVDPLLVFLHLYGKTLNWKKGGGIVEVVRLLLNRSRDSE